MNAKNFKIRASKAAVLMVGGNELTDKQKSRLAYLQERKDFSKGGKEGVKPLTTNMEKELKELKAKNDAPFELGQSAKSYIRSEWLRLEYGYSKPVVSKEMLKGHLVEQDGIDMISRLWPENEFRLKNIDYFTDDFFTGTPDVILKIRKVVEDIKSCWDLGTFDEKKAVEKEYKGQGQVYMHLTGFKSFRLHYCLLPTPIELIESEKEKYFFAYGKNEDNPHYLAACDQIDKNHDLSKIPEEKCLKTFEFDYDPAYIQTLESRMEAARDFYAIQTL